MTDIERRKHSAYWYAAGRCDGEHITDLSDEFAAFAEQQASEYYAGNTHFLGSIPDQWGEFIESRDA
jgi:hypothetical protein